MAVDRANFVPICSFRKGKGLFSYENKPFLHPFGGDKRDRTADLLNAIERLATFYGIKVHEIANIKSFLKTIINGQNIVFLLHSSHIYSHGSNSRGQFKRSTGTQFYNEPSPGVQCRRSF